MMEEAHKKYKHDKGSKKRVSSAKSASRGMTKEEKKFLKQLNDLDD